MAAREQTPKTSLYNRVSVLRADRGWSRQELADRLGINFQTVGYIERGDYAPSLELALRMAREFGVPVEAMFSLEPLRPLTAEIFGEQSPQDPQGNGHQPT